LVYFDGKRRAELDSSLAIEVKAASGGRITDWTTLLSPSGQLTLSRNQLTKQAINIYTPVAESINRTLKTPLLPTADPKSSLNAIRDKANEVLNNASGGRYDNVSDLVYFDGANQSANRLRQQINQYLQKNSAAQAAGFTDWKQLLLPNEKVQLQQTLA
jgi:hypothetical protein